MKDGGRQDAVALGAFHFAWSLAGAVGAALKLESLYNILGLMPATRRDPNGIHGAIWEALTDEEYTAPPGKGLTVAAYESEMGVRAFVEALAVGDDLPEMPLFLTVGAHVPIALESTYQAAWEAVPRRWRSVIEG